MNKITFETPGDNLFNIGEFYVSSAGIVYMLCQDSCGEFNLVSLNDGLFYHVDSYTYIANCVPDDFRKITKTFSVTPG